MGACSQDFNIDEERGSVSLLMAQQEEQLSTEAFTKQELRSLARHRLMYPVKLE